MNYDELQSITTNYHGLLWITRNYNKLQLAVVPSDLDKFIVDDFWI